MGKDAEIYRCKECGFIFPHNHELIGCPKCGEQGESIEPIKHFCPQCGGVMVEGEQIEGNPPIVSNIYLCQGTMKRPGCGFSKPDKRKNDYEEEIVSEEELEEDEVDFEEDEDDGEF